MPQNIGSEKVKIQFKDNVGRPKIEKSLVFGSSCAIKESPKL